MSTDVNASTTDTASGTTAKDPLAVAEQRRKDAQAALTPLQQENARLKAELEASKTLPTVEISPERQEALDDLKFTDPDAWRKEMNSIESENATVQNKHINDATKKQLDITQAQTFFNDNPELDQGIVRQIIPTAIQKRYEDGELTILEVLEVGKKLMNGAPIATVLAPDSPNLGKVSGSDKPTKKAKEKQVEVDWATAVV